jgi:hypothetical protein
MIAFPEIHSLRFAGGKTPDSKKQAGRLALLV